MKDEWKVAGELSVSGSVTNFAGGFFSGSVTDLAGGTGGFYMMRVKRPGLKIVFRVF